MKYGRGRRSKGGTFSAAIRLSVPRYRAHARTEANFAENLRQLCPLHEAGRNHDTVARFLQRHTALPRGLSRTTALKQVASSTRLEQFISGTNPKGKCGEVIAARFYKNAVNVKCVNPPRAPSNFSDCRLSPDCSSARDLIYVFELQDGRRIFRAGAQVKVGSARYIKRSLVKNAANPKYSKSAVVDARFVNPGGVPRVAPDGFTPAQAANLRKAGIELHGIEDLEAQAQELYAHNVEALRHDPDAPPSPTELAGAKIRARYNVRNTIGRAGAAFLIGATVAAGCEAWTQHKDGELDLAEVGRQGAAGGIAGASIPLVETGAFHVAKVWMPADAAQTAASIATCLAATALDVYVEHQRFASGESSAADAALHCLLKTAINFLPLALHAAGLLSLDGG